jgi:uncharacterized membrane protein YGL010W
MLGNRPMSEWIAEYAQSHQHPMNKLTHTFGIPMIVVSIMLLVISVFVPALFWWGIGFFAGGWILQFVGHAFERKAPEFFKDWRFLFVGFRWWLSKMKG